jgi:hypothetical protein
MIRIRLNVIHLLVSLVVAVFVYLLLALVIDFFGLVVFDAKSVLVSIPTVGGVIMLILLSGISSGEIPWSKQGHDFSILAFGAVISTATLQFFWKDPALPRLASGSIGRALAVHFGNDLRFMILAILFCLAIITLAMCVITAIIETGLRNAKTGILKDQKHTISFLNYSLGTISLAFYVAIVCGGI